MDSKTLTMAGYGVWSEEEHNKFLVGLKMYPKGPWKLIATQVGTRSSRQVQTHAQKYYEKVARRMRGLRKNRRKLTRPEHRLDEDMIKLCSIEEPSVPFELCIVLPAYRASTKVAASVSPRNIETASPSQTSDVDLCVSLPKEAHHQVAAQDGIDSDSTDDVSFTDADDLDLDSLLNVLDVLEWPCDGM
ncbi:Myb-like dna-binding protein, partial [Globisporangium splendens]